jgi:platelet-activating factor acetylhydrolase IB subunit alpha
LSFHPFQDFLASSSEDASIRLWDYETGQCEKVLKGHSSKICQICFDAKGTLLASSAKDMTIKIWSL